MKRSYHQYCGLAVAMDLVGERWTMLVVRDLAPGPRRFSDLLAGLPGVATDMLSDRLRSLEAAGVVTQRKVRYPAPANVYELTDYGHRLAEIGRELAQWAEPLLPQQGSPDYRLNPQWALQSMAAAYSGGLHEGEYHLVVDDQDFTFEVTEETATLRYGPPTGEAWLRLECTSQVFFSLATSASRFAAIPKGATLSGSVRLLTTLFRSMPLPGSRRAR